MTKLLSLSTTTLTTILTCTADKYTNLQTLKVLATSTIASACRLKVYVGDGTTDSLIDDFIIPAQTIDTDSPAVAILRSLSPNQFRSTTSPSLTYTIKVQLTAAINVDLTLNYTETT